MPPVKVIQDPRMWGSTALALLAVLATVAAMVYTSPPGSKIVTFYTDDAASVSPGITVRMAGIPVGKITKLSIEPEQVRVAATVNGDAFVGDQSSVQFRMLTVVGGYYVNIDSIGTKPLGASAIPKTRVTPPYSLARALADATDVTRRVDTAPIKGALDQLQTGFAGDNVNTLSATIDAGRTITDILDRQQGQITATLNLTDEWIAQFEDFQDYLRKIVEELSILEATLTVYSNGLRHAVTGLGDIMESLAPLKPFYLDNRREFLQRYTNWVQISRTWSDRSGLVTRILRRTRDRMTATLERQNAAPELLATDLCIPLQGTPC